MPSLRFIKIRFAFNCWEFLYESVIFKRLLAAIRIIKLRTRWSVYKWNWYLISGLDGEIIWIPDLCGLRSIVNCIYHSYWSLSYFYQLFGKVEKNNEFYKKNSPIHIGP